MTEDKIAYGNEFFNRFLSTNVSDYFSTGLYICRCTLWHFRYKSEFNQTKFKIKTEMDADNSVNNILGFFDYYPKFRQNIISTSFDCLAIISLRTI